MPATMESLTLRAVRPMSMSGSTDARTATTSIGSPIVPNTMSEANVAPPPTPATPNELMATTAMSGTKNVGDSTSMPTVGATMVASIAGYTPAHPFCPIDMPKLAARFADALSTPRALCCVSMLSGSAPALERDTNAKLSTGNAFLK